MSWLWAKSLKLPWPNQERQSSAPSILDGTCVTHEAKCWPISLVWHWYRAGTSTVGVLQGWTRHRGWRGAGSTGTISNGGAFALPKTFSFGPGRGPRQAPNRILRPPTAMTSRRWSIPGQDPKTVLTAIPWTRPVRRVAPRPPGVRG